MILITIPLNPKDFRCQRVPFKCSPIVNFSSSIQLMHSTDSPKVIALLPIKKNSSRVPGKNFRMLGNRPLFKWILDTLLRINKIDHIVINTDARHELFDLGLKGSPRITVRDRVSNICGDTVSMNRIIEDDVSSIPADIYLMTHATNPFLGEDTIYRALLLFEKGLMAGECDSLFAVNKVQSRFYRVDGSPVNHNPSVLIQTQDLEPWFEENSNLYLFTSASFARTKARIGAHPLMYEVPRLESLDIDTEEDWALAAAVSKTLSSVNS